MTRVHVVVVIIGFRSFLLLRRKTHLEVIQEYRRQTEALNFSHPWSSWSLLYYDRIEITKLLPVESGQVYHLAAKDADLGLPILGTAPPPRQQ